MTQKALCSLLLAIERLRLTIGPDAVIEFNPDGIEILEDGSTISLHGVGNAEAAKWLKAQGYQ